MLFDVTKVVGDVIEKIAEMKIEKREDQNIHLDLEQNETIWINTPKGMVRVAFYGQSISMGIYAEPQTIDLFKSKGIKFSKS